VSAERVSLNITRKLNAGVLAMLKGAWMARGFFMKCDWLLPNATKI
jgi:hypothetical protein